MVNISRYFRPSWKAALFASLTTLTYVVMTAAVNARSQRALAQTLQGDRWADIAAMDQMGRDMPFLVSVGVLMLLSWLVFIVSGARRASALRRGIVSDAGPVSLRLG